MHPSTALLYRHQQSPTDTPAAFQCCFFMFCVVVFSQRTKQPISSGVDIRGVPGRLLQLFVLMLLHIVQKHNIATKKPSFTSSRSSPSQQTLGTARRSRASAGRLDIFYMISSEGLKSRPSAIRGRRLAAEALTKSKEWFNQEAAFYLEILHPLRCNRRKKNYIFLPGLHPI